MQWRVFHTLLLVVLAAGCGREETPAIVDAPAAQRPALRDTRLPRLDGAEQGIQERIRGRYATLAAIRDRPDAAPADLARAYGEVGKLLIAGEFWAEAQPYFENAQTLDPREVAWPYYLGHSYRMQNKTRAALAAFESAVRLQPANVPALVWLGTLYLDVGDTDRAEPLLRKAVALQPSSAAARAALGRAVLARGDAKSAVEQLEAALASDPAAHPARYSLAMAYRQLGDERRADAQLRQWKDGKVFPADPLMEEVGALLQTAVGFEVQGTRALDAGRWREAADYFRKGLAAAPTDATLHQNLGAALFLGGDEAGAQREFAEALRLSPGYARAHYSLGVLLESRDDDAGALAHFQQAVRFDPAMLNARFSVANALRRTGRADAALAHYETIVREVPTAGQARFGQAMALVRLGRYGDARAVLETATRMHPEQPGFAHALARLLAAAPVDAVRDGPRALTIVRDLLARSGRSPALLETSAMALAEVGQFDAAAAEQRRAIDAAYGGDRERTLPAMQENLRRYEQRLPCRQPWAYDDPVHYPRTSALR